MLELELPCDQCCAVTLVAAVALGCSYEAGGLVVLDLRFGHCHLWDCTGCTAAECYHLSPSGRHVRLAS